MTDVFKTNQTAWDIQSTGSESPWVQPVDSDTIAAARNGNWQVVLTPKKAVPASWFGQLTGKRLLALASGGGQQVPIFAAAGADVVSFDASEVQLSKDRLVAERAGLVVGLEQGDMADLSRFEAESFDLIFHPVSNVFCRDIKPVWQHCARVLKPGGRLMAGFMNPSYFMFDHQAMEGGAPMQVAFKLPFSDLDHLTDEQINKRVDAGYALEFSHSLDSQIGGQLNAGFQLAGFYEDRWSSDATPLNEYTPTSMATLAIRL